ncbi:MAG TPA: UDP-N-acetylglucosamine 2-epimerase (hydrolyzing) [Bacteroidales bacterium]|nr:UDP-N-acetylglucosamine 2-epimerase (hydrolyzing) [Bacteroidales bacterium]
MRKICVITGARSEYGLLNRLMKLIQKDNETQLQLVVTNMHLRPEFGNTYLEIEKDGFFIDKKVYMKPKSDTPGEVVFAMSEEMVGLNQSFEDLKPDLLVLFGDRYEMLVAAIVAMMHKIPIAHIGGGNITMGAYDDNIRHAITKLSHLHFPSTIINRDRVIQLGESPDHVYCVGSLGIEVIKHTQLLNKEEIEKSINFKIDKKTVLATYHPATLSNRNIEDDMRDFLTVLEEKKDLRIIFTMPNSDEGNSIIRNQINQFVEKHYKRSIAFSSLGNLKYLSVMKYVAAVVGNSSSGLVEAPLFGIPTLDIGDRQKGRERSTSVIHCKSDKESILKGLNEILDREVGYKKKYSSPYEKENTAENIFNVIKNFPLGNIIQKQFYQKQGF